MGTRLSVSLRVGYLIVLCGGILYACHGLLAMTGARFVVSTVLGARSNSLDSLVSNLLLKSLFVVDQLLVFIE